jgi:hypothetical protein
MPTQNSLLTHYDESFSEVANAYGPRLENLCLPEKSQLITAIGDWVAYCASMHDVDRHSFYEHIEMTDPFDIYDCDAAKMVEEFLDFVKPLPAMQLAIALAWQIIEGVYSLDEDSVYEGFGVDGEAEAA